MLIIWKLGRYVISRPRHAVTYIYHKFKEPQYWPVDDIARKRTFPSNIKDLAELAEHLSADMAPITDTFFDESIRKEHIYLFVQIADDLSSQRPSFSSASCFYSAISFYTAYEFIETGRLRMVWCSRPKSLIPSRR